MEASFYVRKIALPDIQAFARTYGYKFTLGEEVMDGLFIELHISCLTEFTAVTLAHIIGTIEGRAEEKYNRKQKKE